MSAPRLVRFGTFEFDFSTRELRSNGRRVALQSQPAQVLALLLSNRGQVVSREELRAAIWSDDTFVEFDTALNVAVNKIRQSVRDSASAPRFVETIPKRGYRFLADVHPIVASEASVMPHSSTIFCCDPAGVRAGSLGRERMLLKSRILERRRCWTAWMNARQLRRRSVSTQRPSAVESVLRRARGVPQ